MLKKELTLLFLFLISAVLLFMGYRYYHYTKTNPQFCSVCHIMEEGFKTWRVSVHNDIACQRCHELGIVEANKLLLAFILKGRTDVSQSHGRINTWKGCLKCHTEEVSQGSVTLRKSFGHARHVFMNNIKCKKCHVYDNHNFRPETRLCQRCHTDKLVHGMAMAGLNCLNCHIFGDNAPKFVSQKRCFKCHKNLKMSETMADIKCFDCHKPHGKLKMKSSDCLGKCHMNEISVGQHRIHILEVKLKCLYCHRAHRWKIDQKLARELCSKCHEYRRPELFVY